MKAPHDPDTPFRRAGDHTNVGEYLLVVPVYAQCQQAGEPKWDLLK